MNRTYTARFVAGTLALSCALTGLYIGTARTARAASDAALQSNAAIQALQPDNAKSLKSGQLESDNHPPLVGEAASVLGIGEAELIKQLQAGKSIADVAKERGVSEADLTAKLLRLRTERIDQAVKNGKLDAAKAEDMKRRMGEHLHFMIREDRLLDKSSRHEKRGMKPAPEQLAAILGIGKDELREQLKSGKSIAEIAAAKGIGRDELIAKLKEQMTPQLETWIDRKHPSRNSKE